MYSALAEYYKASVQPQRATVLVQGGHRSGKTTLLNALLGHHVFPYFAARDSSSPDCAHLEGSLTHGGVGRFVAGLGSTAVCFLGVAAADASGPTLVATQASQGTIHSLVVPNTLATALAGLDSKSTQPDPRALSLVGGRVVTVNSSQRFSSNDVVGGTDDGQVPSPHAEHSVALFGESSAFSLADNIYAQDASGSWAAAGPRVWDAQSFFYDAVESMERLWVDWRRGLQEIDPACDPTDKPERMVLIATLQSTTSTPPAQEGSGQVGVDYPPMHFVESTDLADRPPMPYVHTAVAVLHETLDGLQAEDPEGARRMYLKSALYARTNVIPVLVFNLTERSANTVSGNELQAVRQTLASKYGIPVDSVFVLNAQRALADALLQREGIPSQALADSNELERLRRLIASNHIAAHDRMVLRLRQRQQQASPQTSTSTKSAAPEPQLSMQPQAPLAAPFVPRMLTQTFLAEDKVLAQVASRSAGPADFCNTNPALATAVAPELAALLESQRDAVQLVQAHHDATLWEVQEAMRRQISYVPRIAATDGVAATGAVLSTSTVWAGRKTPPPVQSSYVPKCVGEQGAAEAFAVSAVVERQQYVPRCVANLPPSAANPEVAKPFAKANTADAPKPSDAITTDKVDVPSDQKDGDLAAMNNSSDSFELI